jgi:ribose 5-phosphate isomerase B
MKVAFGCDHAGFGLKNAMMAWAGELGHKTIDCGNLRLDPQDDYPDFALAVAVAVARGTAERGIVVCGSGVGASVVVNKIPGVRGAMCHDTFSARQGVEDDDANVMTLGERIIGVSLAREVVKAFLDARFSSLPRHVRRLEKVKQIELDARTGAYDFPEVKE